MTRWITLLLFISPAMADDGSLATCETKNMELMEINTQLGAIAESFRSQLEAAQQRKVQVVRITPVASPAPSRCAGKTAKTEQCKKGRTLNSKCKCGVWK